MARNTFSAQQLYDSLVRKLLILVVVSTAVFSVSCGSVPKTSNRSFRYDTLSYEAAPSDENAKQYGTLSYEAAPSDENAKKIAIGSPF